jgi:hypothetical protein
MTNLNVCADRTDTNGKDIRTCVPAVCMMFKYRFEIRRRREAAKEKASYSVPDASMQDPVIDLCEAGSCKSDYRRHTASMQ